MRRLVLYSWLLIMAFAVGSCNSTYLVTETNLKNSPVGQELATQNQKMVSLYIPYKTSLEKDMSKVIGFAQEEMQKGKPESLLTNFLADLVLAEGNNYLKENSRDFFADVSYFNYGGIRTYIPEGEITVGKIFELMPFENEMVFLKLKGQDLKVFLDNIAKRGGDSLGGVRFTIKDGTAGDIVVNGLPFVLDSEYWLVTNDYIAGGGDDMSMMENRLEFLTTGKLIRELIIGHLNKMQADGESISPKLDGRIKHE